MHAGSDARMRVLHVEMESRHRMMKSCCGDVDKFGASPAFVVSDAGQMGAHLYGVQPAWHLDDWRASEVVRVGLRGQVGAYTMGPIILHCQHAGLK